MLLYDGFTLAAPGMVVPHPRMTWRRFVLEPAAEIAPEMLHPGMDWTLARLLDHLNQTPWYVAIAGLSGVGKSGLAREVAARSGARLLANQANSSPPATFRQGPSGHALESELELVESQARQVLADQPEWQRHDRPTVSDFWFGQSSAFASVWLPEEQPAAYQARWAELWKLVARPRLTVLLRGSPEAVLAGGRPGGETPTMEHLQRLERALDHHLAVYAEGPVLRLDAADKDAGADELTAAIEAMR